MANKGTCTEFIEKRAKKQVASIIAPPLAYLYFGFVCYLIGCF